ncbi:DUF4174 domain-containing protein [Aquimarina algicola]|uniref:DUF4174 domain-containing protein n=1 Tax=Aquimarina algicola TaxID=2589995 RepID=A0A504IWM5_9FLAO|nr:DUF4174 domain-containing protein [Aquimarina algicola]TPN82887.1 DUF4174 domain-containing protein [Aquimarina algicola]
MKQNKTVLISGIIIMMMICFSFMDTYAQDLEKHQWENRVLIIKTLDKTSKKYQKQVKEFQNSIEGLIDRKFVLYKIIKNDFTLINYKDSILNTSGKISKKLTTKTLNKKESFEIILIGLDGQIKLRQVEVLTKEDLFKIVDAMPMRKNELKQNKLKN